MNLKLETNKWYAWQMLPGYAELKYHSPIKILDIVQSTGTDSLVLNFYNACYNQGTKLFCYELKIIAHTKVCLICEVVSNEKNKLYTMAIIEEIDYQWIGRYIEKASIHPNINISEYLDKCYCNIK